ncbi:LacI family transcriptional regulator [Butyrivibrio sp. DSM 10294]|uniref:LacI family DNA-binding transcriptional regulator n=1 Tax=Butyrivibrio sp. DSM 10294 TaxID=2972457 RepID=UPI00234EF2AB|nr:LacI family DNA-binding transcriptional regulator [Butyrivibrio sp. DSM 10294]MDC7294546.1 LacI family transcriptional regulator [Butyrivibrio sp. DSM 10294]
MNIKMIAQQAGVSTATVSNVLNGNYGKVSQATRQKVEEIIKATGYKPNVIARSLARKESRLIGVVVPYMAPDEDFFANPYNAHILASLEKYIRGKDYYLMLRCVGDARDIVTMLSSWNVDGAVFLGIYKDEVREIRELIDMPVVFLDTYAPDEKIVNVGIEDYRGGYLSARYLIGKGHDKLALVTPEITSEGVIKERYRGFSDACREAGIPFKKGNIYYSQSTYNSAVQVGQDLAFKSSDYTAVACMSDIVAFGVIEGLKQCGIRVPYDMSVIGFDNLPDCELMTPKLTSVAQDFEWKVKKAGDYLFRMIESGKTITADERQPLRIVERQSVRNLRE